MQIKLTKDTVTPELKRVLGEVKRPAVLYQAGAKAVQVGISKHLKGLQARGNKRGWPSRHFFAGGPTSVERRVGIARVSDTGAEVTIADPRFVHRIEGGTVTAKRAKMLAIPLTAEAYGMGGKGTLREAMPGLHLVVTKKGAFLAKEKAERRGKVKGLRYLFLFKLVRSVTHGAHPEEMPNVGVLAEGAREAMLKVGKRLMGAK